MGRLEKFSELIVLSFFCFLSFAVLNFGVPYFLVVTVELLHRSLLLYNCPSAVRHYEDIGRMLVFFYILVLALLISNYGNFIDIWYSFGVYSTVCSLVGALFLYKAVKANFDLVYLSTWIEHSNDLDYGACMAHQFFYGYLRRILPNTGTEEKYLLELMQDYESHHSVKFACKKLFVLIPKSLHCPTSLVDCSEIIECGKSLEPLKQSVAGVKDRIYRSSVYKINDKGRLTYVVAEYSTPLHTYLRALENSKYSAIFKKHKDEIVWKFYSTLQDNLKNDPNCRKYCELILFDDELEANHDVGLVLLRTLRKYQTQLSATT